MTRRPGLDPRLEAVARAHGGVFSSALITGLDVDEHDLVAWRRSGAVRRVRRDAYVLGSAWAEADASGRLALRARAVIAARGFREIASHQSALALHGLPVLGVPTDTVDVVAEVTKVRLANGLRSHPPVPGLDVVVLAGYRAAAIAPAVVQVTARSGLLAGLVPLDRALHDGRCDVAGIDREVDRLPAGSRARRRAAALLDAADPRAESVGETRTRLLLRDLGYRPLSQVTLVDRFGVALGRVDFLIGERLVVEFDGAVKYAGAEGRRALAAEKAREDALRAEGYVVVRVTWGDLDHPERVARMIRRAEAQLLRRDGVVAAS